MTTDDLEEERTLINRKIMKYFGLFMAVVYGLIGAFVMMLPDDLFGIAPLQKKMVGILFVLYGLFRFYKTYRQYFGRKT
jgi:surface polysaccharide O-acyltransferase-like enzyme